MEKTKNFPLINKLFKQRRLDRLCSRKKGKRNTIAERAQFISNFKAEFDRHNKCDLITKKTILIDQNMARFQKTEKLKVKPKFPRKTFQTTVRRHKTTVSPKRSKSKENHFLNYLNSKREEINKVLKYNKDYNKFYEKQQKIFLNNFEDYLRSRIEFTDIAKSLVNEPKKNIIREESLYDDLDTNIIKNSQNRKTINLRASNLNPVYKTSDGSIDIRKMGRKINDVIRKVNPNRRNNFYQYKGKSGKKEGSILKDEQIYNRMNKLRERSVEDLPDVQKFNFDKKLLKVFITKRK